jgi:hypothetical protein
LDDPNDFVRLEIESALRLGKRVIPVLVNGADMPREEQLPASLRALARRNAVRLTHERFRTDAQGLIGGLKRVLDESEAARLARQAEDRRQAEREAAAEAEARAAREEATRAAAQREAEEAARAADAERRRRAEAERAAEAERRRQAAAEAEAERQRMDRARRSSEAAPAVPSAPAQDAFPSAIESSHDTIAPAQSSDWDGIQDAPAAEGPLRNQRDLLAGLVFLVLGIVGFVASPGLLSASSDTATATGPSYFPAVVALITALLGGAILARSMVSRSDPIEPIALRTVVLVLSGCALFGLLLQKAGLIVALAVMGAVSMAAAPSARFDWRPLVSFAAFMVFAVVVFVWGLKLAIPLGGSWFGN